MRGRLGAMVMTTMVALALLAIVAPAALASWSLYEVTGYEMGYVVKTNSTKFTVKKNSGVKVEPWSRLRPVAGRSCATARRSAWSKRPGPGSTP